MPRTNQWAPARESLDEHLSSLGGIVRPCARPEVKGGVRDPVDAAISASGA